MEWFVGVRVRVWVRVRVRVRVEVRVGCVYMTVSNEPPVCVCVHFLCCCTEHLTTCDHHNGQNSTVTSTAKCRWPDSHHRQSLVICVECWIVIYAHDNENYTYVIMIINFFSIIILSIELISIPT